MHGFGYSFTLLIPDLLKIVKNNSSYSNNACFSQESVFYICCFSLRSCIINYFSDWKKEEGEKVKIQLPWKKKIHFLEAASASELKICWVFSFNELSKYELIKWNLSSYSCVFCLPQAAALHDVSGVSCSSSALRFVTFKDTVSVSPNPCALGSLAVNFRSSHSHGSSVYTPCALSLCSWSKMTVCHECSKSRKQLLLVCCPQVQRNI